MSKILPWITIYGYPFQPRNHVWLAPPTFYIYKGIMIDIPKINYSWKSSQKIRHLLLFIAERIMFSFGSTYSIDEMWIKPFMRY